MDSKPDFKSGAMILRFPRAGVLLKVFGKGYTGALQTTETVR